MKRILLIIDETAADRPGDVHSRFHQEKFYFDSPEQMKEFLKDRYGKIPAGKNKIYQDPNSEEIGFTHSFWNKDVSHNSKSWHQTDWISVYVEERTPAPELIK